MHDGQVATDAGLLRRLLAAQFPQWQDLPIAPVASFGTDHDIYRLGDELAARLPIIGWAEAQAAKEALWMPRLAPALPLDIPKPRALGRPGEGYPFQWSVVDWIPGQPATTAAFDPDQAARDLAAFVRALRLVPTTDAPPRPPGARGAPLPELDAIVRHSLRTLDARVDRAACTALWDAALDACEPSASQAPVWVHGDLLPGNWIVRDGRIRAVIDFGGLNVGDGACDLQPAWHAFAPAQRAIYRDALDCDDAAWARGRGWVLYQVLTALAYYAETNAGIVAQSQRALDGLLESR